MENITDFFTQIAENLPKKNIIKFCKKLAKRKTLNAENAVDELCDLCVWLYVYGAYDTIIQCAEVTHTFPIPDISPKKDGLKFWHLYDLWGMEMRALKLTGQTERALEIGGEIDRMQMTLRNDGLKGLETPEEAASGEIRRRERVTYDELSCEQYLELAGKPISEQGSYRIYKSDIPFYQMRGIRCLVEGVEVGVYPNLDIEKAEATIQKYAAALRLLD